MFAGPLALVAFYGPRGLDSAHLSRWLLATVDPSDDRRTPREGRRDLGNVRNRGVLLFALQFATMFGAQVIAATSSDEKPALCRISAELSSESVVELALAYVGGDFRQIVAELMSTSIELADGCSRQSCCVQRKVCERHDLVVTAVVEKESRYL